MKNQIRKTYLDEHEFIKIANQTSTIMTLKGGCNWLYDTSGILFLLKVKGVYMNLYTLFSIESFRAKTDGIYHVCIRKMTEPTVDHFHIVEQYA